MDFGSILIGLALAVAVAAYIGQPILAKSGRAVTVEDRQLSELQAQRDRILSRVQELDMDFTMGKILDQDYQRERGSLMTRGAEVLKAIDEMVGSSHAPALQAAPVDDIEAAVARIRGKSISGAAAFCPSCGAEVQSGDAFCTRCGSTLQATGGAD